MGTPIRFGKIFGIEIALDVSWFLILALVTWSLSGYYFALLPELSLVMRWSLALVTSILFFASVLTHELAHSLVSKAQGIPVSRITLFIFGGAAQISEEPRRAQDEFWMALVGPLTSLALAAAFEMLWFVTRGASLALSQMLEWLASINALLAIFNLLPGFPLDGGRVLRAIIWGFTKNLRRATRVAVACGVGLAWMIMSIGFWQMITSDWINGIWFMLIGWFLQGAARQAGEATKVNDALRGHTAREALMTNYSPVPLQLPLHEFVHSTVISTGQAYFPVMEHDDWLGLITLHRVLKVSRAKWATTRVADVMIPRAQVVTATSDEGLTRILEKMVRTREDQVAVVDASSGRFLGIVTRENIFTFMCAQDDSNGKR